MQIAISNEEFYKFREFFYRKTGIYFDDSKRYFVDRRLIQRIKAVEAENFRAYFVMLRFEASGEEMQHLINIMTVNETYFFREEYQFKCLVQSLLPEIIARKKQSNASNSIRIWSIPCSSGEEPYSLAIYLLEYWSEIENYDVELFASDIDTQILEQAKQGIYQARSLAPLPASLKKKYFTALDSENYQITEELRDVIKFSCINLADFKQMQYFRMFDVIFCRNLLIYFDDQSRALAADQIYDALTSGGFICLGHSESMSRISNLFSIRRFPEATVYQKPL